MAAVSDSEEGTVITVRDKRDFYTFRGVKIAEKALSYAEAQQWGRHQWTDLFLYEVRTLSDPCFYVLQTVARSVVYHRADGSCRRGVRTAIKELGADEKRYAVLTPCEVCSPAYLDSLEDDDEVFAERDFPHFVKFYTADEAAAYLSGPNVRGRRSGVSAQLLESAIEVDKSLRWAHARAQQAAS